MKLLTAEQMKKVDRQTIERGTPGIVLMRNAGKAVSHLIMTDATESPRDRIVVIAGKGNNGGDGCHAAELLAKKKRQVEIILVGEKKDIRGDALICLEYAEKAGVTVTEINEERDLEQVDDRILGADVIVDALFGTGLKGDIKGLAASVVRVVNKGACSLAHRPTVVAVDIPSGVNSSTGEISGETVHARYTVTFGCLKVGHVFGPGKQRCGEVTVADIGFDPHVMDAIEPFGFTLTRGEAAKLIPARRFDAHKGTAGRVFVLTGSVGLTGASALSSRAALRIGAGMVTAGCPASLNDILEMKMTEVMTLPLPEVKKKRCLSLRALGMVRAAAEKADVIAVGPGLGMYHETAELVRRFISGYEGRVVLDADGINAFKGQGGLLKQAHCEIVLTPHVGELARLLDTTAGEILKDPSEAAKQAAQATGKYVLLKGAPTVIADTSGNIWVNPTGNEAMATAGMGDVLTGAIAGLAAQGVALFDAAVLGAYLHGIAGEQASKLKGIHGVIAGDVLDLLPDAINCH